jgi:hypothetical protein
MDNENLKFNDALTEVDYEKYANRPKLIWNEVLRDPKQKFSDAMCESSIVDGVENGEKILEIIRNAGG